MAAHQNVLLSVSKHVNKQQQRIGKSKSSCSSNRTSDSISRAS